MFTRNVARLLAHRSLTLTLSGRLGSNATLAAGAWPTASCTPRRRLTTRSLSTAASSVGALSEDAYHEYADMTMDGLLDSLEHLVDEKGHPGHEVEYHSGVLTLQLGEHGTYVINKQPPNKQIWLSSPSSGPKRYDFDTERKDWVYTRDGTSLGDLLRLELGEIYQDSDVARLLSNGPFF